MWVWDSTVVCSPTWARKHMNRRGSVYAFLLLIPQEYRGCSFRNRSNEQALLPTAQHGIPHDCEWNWMTTPCVFLRKPFVTKQNKTPLLQVRPSPRIFFLVFGSTMHPCVTLLSPPPSLTVRHRVLETGGFWPASRFRTGARKPRRQPASF